LVSGYLRLGKETHSKFEIEFLAVVQAECQEAFIAVSGEPEIMNDSSDRLRIRGSLTEQGAVATSTGVLTVERRFAPYDS